MEIERAIEILNPEHREHYESIETINKACRMGMKALEKQIPKKPTPHIVILEEKQICVEHGDWGAETTAYKCHKCYSCGGFVSRLYLYCPCCGQKLLWEDK